MCLGPGDSAERKPRRTADATGRILTRLLSRPGAVLAFLLFCGLSAGIASDTLPPTAPHEHFQRPEACPKCHATAPGVLFPDRFSADSDGFCLGCHRRESLGPSHPVNRPPREVSPPVRIPEPFPLSTGGRLMCLTCHVAHGRYLALTPSFPGQKPFSQANGSGPGYKTYFLRRTSPTDGFAALCRACHGNL